MSDDEHCGQVSSGDESQDYVDTKRWRASAPPEEVFTESENNREWGYDIIGEEVDENGKVM
jgi:GH43 family beta-xylosidase